MHRSTIAMLALLLLPWAQAAELAPPPELRGAPVALAGAAPKSAVVDPFDRAAVVELYNDFFVLLPQVPHNWTGNTASCTAGSTDHAYREAVIDRVNVYRALAGVPGVVVQGTSTQTNAAQAAALVMARNNQLNHFPPTTWLCYSSAASTGASNSNLALGTAGTAAVDLYMDDPGSGNYFVGHRRWLLYPLQVSMASGDIPLLQPGSNRAQALWVLGPFGTRAPTPNGVAWPPRGYVPYAMLPDVSNRWSFSYPNAVFDNATVTMRQGGTSIAVVKETVNNGGYGDRTLVWRPQGVSYARPAADTRYDITISGVGGSGVPTSFSYWVTVIDPDTPAPGGDPPLYANGFE